MLTILFFVNKHEEFLTLFGHSLLDTFLQSARRAVSPLPVCYDTVVVLGTHIIVFVGHGPPVKRLKINIKPFITEKFDKVHDKISARWIFF